MKNIWPTIGGLLAAIGGVFATNENATYALIGKILAAIGVVLLGASAKQFNVTGGAVAQTPEAENRMTDKKV